MKKLTNITHHEGVMALYEYQRDEVMVPLIVVVDHMVTEQDRWSDYPWKRYEGLIVLTQDDIESGLDAFALTFVHIQQRSILLEGDDVMAAISSDVRHVRLQMEVLARQLLIDAREHRLKQHDIEKYRSYLLRANDRMTVGYQFLGMDYVYDLSSLGCRSCLIEDLLEIAHEVDTVTL